MTPMLTIAAFWVVSFSSQSSLTRLTQPVETSLCEIAQNPESFNLKKVRFHAEFLTDHIERSLLIDKSCSQGSILPYLANDDIPGGKAFNDASELRNPATLDETLAMTVTGIFHFSKKPEMCMLLDKEICKRSVEIMAIQDLSLTMKPKK